MCSSCQITLVFKFRPTFSNQEINLTRDFIGDKPTILNISSPSIKFDEYFAVTVGIDGTDSLLHSLNFSELLFCKIL